MVTAGTLKLSAGTRGSMTATSPSRPSRRRAQPGAEPQLAVDDLVPGSPGDLDAVAQGTQVDLRVVPVGGHLDVHHRAPGDVDVRPGQVEGGVRLGALSEGAPVDGDLAAVVLAGCAVVRSGVRRHLPRDRTRGPGEDVVEDRPVDAVGTLRGVVRAGREIRFA